MEVVHQCCCGVDVHKGSVTACVVWAQESGRSSVRGAVTGRLPATAGADGLVASLRGDAHRYGVDGRCTGSRCGTFWRAV